MFEFANKTLHQFTYKREYAELVLYSFVAFFVPFLIGNPQIVVGVLVNVAIILSSVNLRKAALLPAIVLPSLAVFSRGLIFGPFTLFLLYLIPFIWMGNAILSFAIKYFYVHKKQNYFIIMLASSAVKAGFLFGIAYTLYAFHLVPALFLVSMGIIQFITAVSAGLIAHGIIKLMKNPKTAF